MRKLKGLIFDLDGTLANTETKHYLAWRNTLLANGVREFSMETFLGYVGTSNEKVACDHARFVGGENPVKRLIREKQSRYLELIGDIELCPGVMEILQRFSGKLVMAVATSSHRREATKILDRHGLNSFFELLIGGDMVSKRKPDPEIYLEACRLLGLDPEECVAFEDSSHGVVAARRAGLKVVAVPNEFTENHDFTRADRVVQSLVEVDQEFLDSLAKSRIGEMENGQ